MRGAERITALQTRFFDKLRTFGEKHLTPEQSFADRYFEGYTETLETQNGKTVRRKVYTDDYFVPDLNRKRTILLRAGLGILSLASAGALTAAGFVPSSDARYVGFLYGLCLLAAAFQMVSAVMLIWSGQRMTNYDFRYVKPAFERRTMLTVSAITVCMVGILISCVTGRCTHAGRTALRIGLQTAAAVMLYLSYRLEHRLGYRTEYNREREQFT